MADVAANVPPAHEVSGMDSANTEGSKLAKKKDKKKPVKKEAKPSKEDAKEKKFSKHVARIKEEMAKQREEEERLQREEAEAERLREEERLRREAAAAREQELREKRKQKEKERRQRLKEEGKLLTDKQKEDRRKVMELLQTRGAGLPEERVDLNKKPQYRKLKKVPASQKTVTKEAQGDDVLHHEEGVPDDVENEEESNWEIMADALDKETEEGLIEDQVEEINETKPTESHVQVPERGQAFTHTDVVLSDEEKHRLIQLAKCRIKENHDLFEANRSEDRLRAGVICVLGHVDTGKTKILDKLRNTNVQDREAGGITQQIGATNVPSENIRLATKMCGYFNADALRVPGMLIIDTPGHESFSNLRVRGSSLCDLAILVVDLMHGLEEQTKESIKILRSRKTPFIVALNKIDRLYGWKSNPDADVKTTIESQDLVTKNDFADHLKKVVQDFALMELNVELFYNDLPSNDYVSMVPTSAHTGDGMGDLIASLCMYLQTQLAKRLAFSEELKASVMEVKELHGLGTTIDVIVVNGRLREGDTIVLAGQEGPIATQVRGVLMPAPMSELRVKGSYEHLKEVVGAQGVKLIAKDLEKALAGLPLYVATDISEELYFKEEVSRGLRDALKAISVAPIGVYVIASTLGSLESLLVYLKSVDIPYSGISIGTVHKKDVMKASVMVEREPKWAVILAFDVKVDRDAQKLATELNVRIFTSEIIYRLQTQMEEYIEDLKRGNRRKHRDLAIFPCKLRILPDMVFNKRAPIVMGVHVEAGLLREGTPICVPSRECVHLGRVFSIEFNHKPVQEARTGQEVCVRIDPLDSEAPKLYGRHFDHNDILVSKITRESIDVVKEHFRSDLTKDDWKLMVELKNTLNVL